MDPSRPRDIDYAAKAVRAAIEEKFGRKVSLDDLEVTAGAQTILLADKSAHVEGTRDQLLAAVRKAAQYEEIWQLDPAMQLPRT